MKAHQCGRAAVLWALEFLACGVAGADEPGDCTAMLGRVEVTGVGTVEVMPDVAWLNYDAVEKAKTPKEAREAVERRCAAFFAALKQAGVTEAQLTAENLVLTPRYHYDKNGRMQFDNYEARRSVTVKTEDFGKIGELTDAAVNSGLNVIGDFTYTLKDEQGARTRAEALAMADARDQARRLAAGFEVELGRPCALSFEERTAAQPQAKAARAANAMMMLAADRGAPDEAVYAARKIEVRAEARAVYALK